MAVIEACLVDITELNGQFETYDALVQTGVDYFYRLINQRILTYEKHKGKKLDHFAFDCVPVKRSNWKFDPVDIRTWNKEEIITKWMIASNKKQDGLMDLFSVVTSAMVPEAFEKTALEFATDFVHGLEEKYSGDELPRKKMKEIDSYEAIALFAIFRFNSRATDLELVQDIEPFGDAMLNLYTEQVVQRIEKCGVEYFENNELPNPDDYRIKVGTAYTDEGNRLVFDRMKFETWLPHGLTEEQERYAKLGYTTIIPVLALTKEILPRFLDGYRPQYPHEFVTQDLALVVAEAIEKGSSNKGALFGLAMDSSEEASELQESPWEIPHEASVVFFAYRDSTLEIMPETNSKDSLDSKDVKCDIDNGMPNGQECVENALDGQFDDEITESEHATSNTEVHSNNASENVFAGNNAAPEDEDGENFEHLEHGENVDDLSPDEDGLSKENEEINLDSIQDESTDPSFDFEDKNTLESDV